MKTKITLIGILIIMGMTSFSPRGILFVSCPAFMRDSMIPSKYSCEGEGSSPALLVSNIPPDAKSLAIIMHDPDAPKKGGFTHWVVWNIPVDGHIPENFKGGDQGNNGAKKTGYTGMCPPSGTHHYHFKVYALDTKLELGKNTDKEGLEKAMELHILCEGELVGLYKKTK